MTRRTAPFYASACAAALAVCAPASAGNAPPPPDPAAAALSVARAIEQQLVTTVETVCQSSVTVLNRQIPKAVPGQPPTPDLEIASIGSGVIVTRNNKTWILTNYHVVEGAAKLDVITQGGVTRHVEVEDIVKQFDIALLRFTDPKLSGIKAVPVVGKRSAELDEGQWCIATGNPFGLAMDGTPVVTLGVISGKDRVLAGNLMYGRAIQHDAAVNPGNSGGPLWNLKGEFVGINGMIQSIALVAGQTASNQGASYSIPVEEIDAFLGQLTDAKREARAGFLGVVAQTDTDKATGKPVGARITAIDPRSPANVPKGLKRDDIIESISVNGSRTVVRTESELINALALCPCGTKVSIAYRRAGKPASWAGELTAQQ